MNPFPGVPGPWWVLLALGLAVVVGMLAWTVVLLARGTRARMRAPSPPADGAAGFLWVFLVPALNEEVTIADSLARLLAVDVPRRRIVVIDDGSDDATPRILAGIDHPDVVALRRDPPDARRGKAAALNHAYRLLDRIIGDTPRERVVVVVVDADGRLRPDAPRWAAAHFADEDVGGVQSLVRIYNRSHLLTWMQDIEFSVYGYLFQAGRNGWGTAGMGGNGQFNRLSALDDIADHEGPWRHRLTEDQDLGLRLIGAGWLGRQELRSVVEQQGIPGLRRLFRQRTRWSQGNLQAMDLMGTIRHAPQPLGVRAELAAYLFMPFWQAVVGVALVTAVALAVTGTTPIIGDPSWGRLALVYVLAFGGTVLGCLAGRAGRDPRSWIEAFLIGHLYALYTWLLWPVLLRSTMRQIISRQDWHKTEREPLKGEPGAPAGAGLEPAPPGPRGAA